MHLIYNPERLRIAVQKSGRLHESSMRYLAECGLTFLSNGKSLIQSSENANVDILHLRDDDIPEYVRRGVADFGIVGENVLAERGIQLPVVAKLGFGLCKLMIAVPKNSRIKELSDLLGKRIATSYPTLLTEFLKQRNVEVDVVLVAGSAEITVELDLADAVCDIVQSGATLAAHDLEPLFTVMKSQAILIESRKKNNRKAAFLKQI